MRDYFRIFIALPIFLVIFFGLPTNTSANYTFNSDFDSDLNLWIAITDHPTPTIENSDNRIYARFSAPYGRKFPFISHGHDSNFISKTEFEFSYLSAAASQGSGVMLSNLIPETNQDPPNDMGNYSVGIWNLGSDFYIVTPLCDNIGGCGLSIYSRAVFKVPTSQWNKIQFLYHIEELEIKLNDSSIKIPYGFTHKRPIGFLVGNPVNATNSQSWLPFSIDNLSITYGDYLELENFPYASQKNPLWKDVAYDSANEWAGDQANTIERWGCAITSVAMLLEKYGVKMPSGDLAKPDMINQWLNNQPDGYVGNGLLNWLAISRLVKESRTVGNATKDLEFVKSSGSATEEIDEGYYPIINEGGHFVVAHDHDGDYYQINDPNNDQRSVKLKTDQIVSVNTYIPSDTDLSYLMIVGEPTTNISLRRENASVGDSYLENINDDVGGGDTGSSLITYLRNPQSGTYKLDVNNNGSSVSKITVYAYDLLGNVDVVNLDVPTGNTYWNINYQNNGDDPIIQKRDVEPPEYTGTNLFTGWYNQPQVAVFSFEDQNLPSDFVMPSCTISNEGYGQTCKVQTTVCDAYDNCASHTLISNPVNIDLTKPATTRKIWGIGMWPLSHIHWLPVKDAEQYRIEWGKDAKSLNSSYTTKKTWAWIPTPKYHRLYVRVIVIDRAVNESSYNKVTELPVWRGHWKFW